MLYTMIEVLVVNSDIERKFDVMGRSDGIACPIPRKGEVLYVRGVEDTILSFTVISVTYEYCDITYKEPFHSGATCVNLNKIVVYCEEIK